MNFEPNQLIDNRYKIIKKLDEGGMGAVWKATDSRTNNSIVVLKFPLEYNDSEILERFAREAGTMRALAGDCDNILDIQDIGSVAVNEIDNVPYYVMRFQTGGALRDWSVPKDEQGNLMLTQESLNWVTGVATALDFLHQQEDAVFHRDVKPENILFNASGTPKLSDFGIVKNIKKATTNITQTGAAMGTVAYMPPEIWRGGKFSPASDQFSFAATVYEMVSSKRPYDGETPFAMLESLTKGHQRLSDAIGLSELSSDAMDKGLAHEPTDRFDSCRTFAKVFLRGLPSEDELRKPSEMVTGLHSRAASSQLHGGELVGGTTGQAAGKGEIAGNDSGEKLFGEQGTGRIVPKVPAAESLEPSGGVKPVLFAMVALVAAVLLGSALYLSGAFSGSNTNRTQDPRFASDNPLELVPFAEGGTVVGNVVLPEEVPEKYVGDAWSLSDVVVVVKNSSEYPNLTLPDDYSDMENEERSDWYQEFRRTKTYKEHARDRREYVNRQASKFSVDEDGSFEIAGLKPGKYDFSFVIPHEHADMRVVQVQSWALGQRDVEVKESGEVVQLESVELQPKNVLMRGDNAPDFLAQTYGGRELSLSDYHGKYVLMEVFAFW